MGKVLGAMLLSAAVVGGGLLHTGMVVVDVHEADGAHVVVPVPLAVARAGSVFLPDEAERVHAPEFAEARRYADRIVDGLRGSGDGTLVEVRDGDEHVTVTKEGHSLLVRVREGTDKTVDVVVPLRSVEAVVEAYDEEGGYFRTSDLLAALSHAPDGELVDVADGGDRVEIRRLF